MIFVINTGHVGYYESYSLCMNASFEKLLNGHCNCPYFVERDPQCNPSLLLHRVSIEQGTIISPSIILDGGLVCLPCI